MEAITFFNMNENDFSKKLYREFYSDLIDFKNLESTYMMCDFPTLHQITNRVSRQLNTKLSYLGNGNYHYLTFSILAQLKEPFTLITFDHHNDARIFPFQKMTSCGSWINDAMKWNPFLREVFIIGVDVKDKQMTAPNNASKIRILSKNDTSTEKLKRVSDEIKTEAIYLSIDRDFLSTKDVQTNWDQGEYRVSELLDYIQVVSENHRVLGADVCGDYVWDYRTMKKQTMQKVLRQSIQVNNQIFQSLATLNFT